MICVDNVDILFNIIDIVFKIVLNLVDIEFNIVLLVVLYCIHNEHIKGLSSLSTGGTIDIR